MSYEEYEARRHAECDRAHAERSAARHDLERLERERDGADWHSLSTPLREQLSRAHVRLEHAERRVERAEYAE